MCARPPTSSTPLSFRRLHVSITSLPFDSVLISTAISHTNTHAHSGILGPLHTTSNSPFHFPAAFYISTFHIIFSYPRTSEQRKKNAEAPSVTSPNVTPWPMQAKGSVHLT